MPTINDLPAEDLVFLANDPGFSEYISADPELDALDAEKFNPALELRMIAELSGCMYKIGTAVFPPVYPLLLSYLWVLDNPFITHSREKTELDADIFLFLLHSRDFSGSPKDLILTASGFCKDNQIPFETAKKEIFELLAVAHNPLSFHPKTSSSDTPAVYDADWLTNKLSAAALKANCSAENLLYKPLSAVLWWYTQARRDNEKNPNAIRRRTPEEIATAEMERIYDLALEYLKNKK